MKAIMRFVDADGNVIGERFMSKSDETFVPNGAEGMILVGFTQ